MEYLFMLEDALEELLGGGGRPEDGGGGGGGGGDAHVRGLGMRVREIVGLQQQQQQQQQRGGKAGLEEDEEEVTRSGVGRATTGDEQAETEKP